MTTYNACRAFVQTMENETRDKQNCIRLPATTGPRPYRCEICQRSFREVATLRKHEQLHRADRPYICQTCGKSFLWSSNLKVHERVHTGERPYKCKICHRCFTQSNDLRRHERNVHMRGKLYSYKTPNARQAPPTGQMNFAAYQAFALQQRALLQHALTYESIMQNAAGMTGAVTQSHFTGVPHHNPTGQASLALSKSSTDLTVTTSSTGGGHAELGAPHLPPRPSSEGTLKLEQVTPPITPVDSQQYNRSEDENTSHTSGPDDGYMKSPGQSRYSPNSRPNSSKAQSPPTLSSTTYGLQNGNRMASESPEEQQNEEADLRNSEAYSKYYAYASSRPSSNGLPQNHHSAIFNHAPNVSDSVMDLSVNKSLSSADSEDDDWKARNSSLLSSKSLDSESECESKRDVTTTSASPSADSGIHHCPHCNIFFHDYTMFHLHDSLHSPVDEDPFTCPSCLKHCQDRVEFMFHIVWHVKYPHTIPKYQPFKDSYLSSDL